MKLRTFLACTPLLLCACKYESNNDAKKEVLKTVLSDYYNAMAKKDLTAMNALSTPDFVMYDEGVIYNNESAVKYIEQMPAFTVSFKFDSIKAHIDKANASAYYLKEAKFVIQDSSYAPMRFLESATFRKEGDKWKLRFLHTTIRK